MLIGALSDSHGRLDTTGRAVEMLKEKGAQMLLHMGDVGSAHVLDLLAGTPAGFVFGNTDGDRKHLEAHAQVVGVRCYGVMGRITFGEQVLNFLHGDDYRQMQKLIDTEDCDLLLHGHTHVRNVEDIGRVRIVNPGALHRANPHTVALIDTTTRHVEFLIVKPTAGH